MALIIGQVVHAITGLWWKAFIHLVVVKAFSTP
jgi:hypothetical protein